MASGKPRSTRKLRSWIIEQLESGQFPGVCWDNADKTMFRIPWKHAGKQDFREDQDAALFKVRGPKATIPSSTGWRLHWCVYTQRLLSRLWVKAVLGSRTHRATVKND